MARLSRGDALFAATALLIQVVLVVYFALRTWFFDTAIQVGWVVYALAVPAVIVSLVLMGWRQPWFQLTAGLLFAVWAAFGYYVDIANPIDWRSPIMWSVLVPFVVLYIVAQVSYWWPLGRLGRWARPLWFSYAILFALSTTLNLASHG